MPSTARDSEVSVYNAFAHPSVVFAVVSPIPGELLHQALSLRTSCFIYTVNLGPVSPRGLYCGASFPQRPE